MEKKFRAFFLLSACTVFLTGLNAQKENIVTARGHSPAIPVIKGLAANPILQVMVSVPAGTGTQQYNRVHCTVKDFADIERIDVYLTGAVPFSADSLIGSTIPMANAFDIPIRLSAEPGICFIWLSVVLKKEANINGSVELHCLRLTGAGKQSLPVAEDASVTPRLTGTVIRRAGDDGVNTYRIPGIIQTDRGTLIAVYDVRYKDSKDLPGNIDVGMSRSTDSGKTWEPMRIIMDMGAPHDKNGIGDPSILFDPATKKIFVAALWSKGNHAIAGSMPGISPDSTGQLMLVSSADDGLNWTASYSLTPEVKQPAWHIFFQGPGAGITMKNGTLVFPAQYWDEKKIPYSTIIYSNDHGLSWHGKITGPKSNTTESQVVETKPGTLLLNMRDNRGGFRSIASTMDMGAHWTEHPTSFNALADPVCMGSIIKANVNTAAGNKTDVLFFSNPATSSGRYNITIKASLDLGETWKKNNQLLIDERNSYGYSCLTRIDANTVGIVYEGIKDLYFVRVPVKKIIQ